MATNTTNLDLYKKDPILDGSDTFNIDTMLNDNWNKIDEAHGNLKSEVKTKVDKINGKGLSTNDFTDTIKSKLENIQTGAQVNTVTSVAGRTGAIVVTKSDVGLGSVDNAKQATKAEFDAHASSVASQLANMAQARAGTNQQSLINGNFDVSQRGKSFTNPASATYTLDRWKAIASPDGGAFPTVIHSQEIHYSEDLYGSHKFYRLTSDGAGGGFGVNSSSDIRQQIENGVRLLCGSGKKVTVSFWARSSIANKRIGIGMIQNYGTGGSTSAQEFLKGDVFNLQTYFQKFSYTFTTNTLNGKVFGGNNDDWLGAIIYTMWGTAVATQRFINGATSENYVNAGTIDIAQVQVCVGDAALPFQPRSIGEELALCQRYCTTLHALNQFSGLGIGTAYTTTKALIHIALPTTMRVVPTLVASHLDWRIQDGVTSFPLTAIALLNGFNGKQQLTLECTVAGTLTQFRPHQLSSLVIDKMMILDAEI